MMGTNYYVAEKYCECCNRYDEEYHIGKASWGWAFSFRGYRAERLVSWQAWKQFLKDKKIVNEYGELIDYDWFVEYIEGEKSPKATWGEENKKNLSHNEEGRNKFPFPWFDPAYDWDDEEGYSFGTREFS